MRPFIITSFVGWILKKIADSRVEYNRSFRNLLSRESWFAILIWFFFSLALFFPYMLIMMPFIDTNDQALVFLLIYIAITVLYLAVNGFSIMYKAFKEERQELFNILRKN